MRLDDLPTMRAGHDFEPWVEPIQYDTISKPMREKTFNLYAEKVAFLPYLCWKLHCVISA
jgi:hypothetical protein